MVGAGKDLEHLLGKLGDPLPVQAWSDANGRGRLIEVSRNGRVTRILVSGPFTAEAIDEATEAALARLCRGRQ